MAAAAASTTDLTSQPQLVDEAAVATTASQPQLVDEAAFAAAQATAIATRVLRHVLWLYGQSTTDTDTDTDEDVPWQWNRVAAAPTHADLYRRIGKIETWGTRFTWLITEEHHDAAGNIYTTDGTPLEKHWQPSTPALLRVAANSQHWIPVRTLIPWNCCAAIAIADSAQPDDWDQPARALFTPESTVFVHFTESYGPYPGRGDRHDSADNKYLAQRHISEEMSHFLDDHATEELARVLDYVEADRHISEEMSLFLGGRRSASKSEILTAVLRYIQRANLLRYPGQTVTPDATLTTLLEGHTEPFPLHELGRRLKHHAGELIPSTR
jgi:hypothetical protein